MVKVWKNGRNTTPGDVWIVICHTVFPYCYFTLTASRILFFLSIVADDSLFSFITRFEYCHNFDLPLWSHFNFSFTLTSLWSRVFSTSPCCNPFFSPRLFFTLKIAYFWSVFYNLAILVAFTCWSLCLSVYHTLLPCHLYFIPECASIVILRPLLGLFFWTRPVVENII